LRPIVVSIAAVSVAVALVRSPILLAWPLVAAGIVCGYLARELYDYSVESAPWTHGILAMILVASAFFGLIAPALDPLFPSATLAELVRTSGCPNPAAASAGYREPSLVFLLGTQTPIRHLRRPPRRFPATRAAAALLLSTPARSPILLQRARAIGLSICMEGRK